MEELEIGGVEAGDERDTESGRENGVGNLRITCDAKMSIIYLPGILRILEEQSKHISRSNSYFFEQRKLLTTLVTTSVPPLAESDAVFEDNISAI